jgi:four helix bundle protein
MSEINDYKDLKIWQKGMDIAEKCYELTRKFPKEELYGMISQIRRASASIPANISEGYGRRSTSEYIRFLNIAKGSMNELETHLILSTRVRLSSQEEIEPILRGYLKSYLCCQTSLPIPHSPFPTPHSLCSGTK